MLKKFKELAIGEQFSGYDGVNTMKTSAFMVEGKRYNAVTVNAGSLHEIDPNDINNYAEWVGQDKEVSATSRPIDGLNHEAIRANKFIEHFLKDEKRFEKAIPLAKRWLELITTPIEGSCTAADAHEKEVLEFLQSVIAQRELSCSSEAWRDFEVYVLKWSQRQF